MSGAFAGGHHLLRLGLRRDRVRLPLWLAGLGGTIVASALAVPGIYDTPEKVAGYAATVGASPVSHLMSGRQAGIDSLGGIVANEISQVAQLGISLMVVFLVVRHTRAEEESGRAELVRSAVVGRHAATLAGLLHAVAAAVLIGAVTTGAMLGAGLEATGSVTYGAGLTLLGLCYAAVALVAAQLATSARGALALAGAAVAVGYLVRGLGAMRDDALVWASPFGWAQRMDAFGDEQWWPAVLLLGATAALLGVAAGLTARRDFAGGVLDVRPGRPVGSRLLGTPVGLTLRLQRGLLVGWAAGLTALALLYGAVVPTVPDLVASNPDIGEALGASAGAEESLVAAFLGYVHVFLAVVSCGWTVATVLRLRAEEERGGAELVLATPLSRTTWATSYVVVAGAGALLLSLLMGLGLGVGHGLATGEAGRLLDHVAGQVSHLPGVLLVGGVAVAVGGLLPRWSPLAWAAVAVVALQVLLGDTLRLPSWLQGVSPFWHLARVPVEGFAPGPAVGVLVGSLVLALAGLAGYRGRDLAPG